jgi:hypothetical protein
MSSILRQIVFDCTNAATLARFWADALEGFEVRPYDDEEIARLAGLGFTPETDPVVLVDGPDLELCFQQVDEDKATKNRLHLDLVPSDRRGEVERLVALGATVLAEHDGNTVLADPEGNEFCVTDPR